MIEFASRHVVLTLAGVLLVSGTATSQRVPTPVSAAYSVPTDEGTIFVDTEASPTTLVWERLTGPDAPRETSVELPFDIPGNPIHLGSRLFLVPGVESDRSTATLALVRLEDQPMRITIEETVSYGARFDPYRVLWNEPESTLYLFDFLRSEIWAAPFDGTALPDSSLFVSTATPTNVPILGYAGYTLNLFDVNGPGVGIVDTEEPLLFSHLAPSGPGAWSATELSAGGSATDKIVVQAASAVAANGASIVVGNVQGSAILEEKTFLDLALGQVSLPDPQTYLPIALPPGGILPGLFYEVRSDVPGAFPGHSFMALVRHGTPQETAELKISPGQIAASGLWTGNQDFHVVGAFADATTQSAPVNADVYLWFGARRPDGTDPVFQDPISGVWYLSEVLASVGPTAMTIQDPLTAELRSEPMPIPQEPALQGGVLLMQWVVVPQFGSGEPAVSDIFGAMITQPWPTAGAGATQGWFASAQERLPAVPTPSHKAIKTWLGSREAWALQGKKRQVWSSLVGRKM